MTSMPAYYEFFCPTKIVSGRKALANLPHELVQLGSRRPLVVTDKGIVDAGLLDKVRAVFEGADCVIAAVFDDTPVDSSDRIVAQVARLFGEASCDALLAVGGGSAIDTAKAANIVITEGSEDLLAFQGADRITKPLRPLVVVPTTAGTGSEVTAAAVVYNTAKGIKMAFSDGRLLPHVAILDPKMTLTLPPKLTAATGMDALTHAMEAYYCIQKNPVSDAFAAAAIRLVAESLLPCVEDGADEGLRLTLANAALLAGVAFSNSLVGVVHGLAHATGGVAHVPHGVANAIFLPWGIEQNIGKRADIIAEMLPMMGGKPTGSADHDARAVAGAVRALTRRLHDAAGLPTSLRQAGVREDQLEAIARAAINDGSMAMNPEEVTYADALELLRKAY